MNKCHYVSLGRMKNTFILADNNLFLYQYFNPYSSSYGFDLNCIIINVLLVK